MNHSKQPDRTGSASLEEQERVQRELNLVLAQESQVDLAAADWHKRHVAGLSAQEAQDFAQWRAQSPAHAAAYDDMVHSYQLQRDLSQEDTPRLQSSDAHAWARFVHAWPPELDTDHDAAQAPSHASKPRASHRSATPQGASRGRYGWGLRQRHVLAAGVCSALFALVAWLAWQAWNAPSYQASYATVQDQRQEIALKDGSQLVLDSNTHVNVALYRNRRELQLLDGQILLDVAPNTQRPWQVQAGSATLRVLGTRFSVRHRAQGEGAGEVNVQVEAGIVEVHAQSAGNATPTTTRRILHAKQGLQVSPAGVMGAVTALPAGDIAPWRSGLIRFSNTPLAQALVELERYGPTKLAITDPKVAALPIDGMYEANRPDRFAKLLTNLHPVQLVPREDGQIEIQLRR
ncbi:DUF4880 domain-containing protein [Lampropedia aestuarii]|uniref:DUF4880 domain-containing protein n=1 Tax=Lampropedia aestuarii TaxID=2562762 RepID=A0A4S5BQQ1_9BURK|nr:FecR domain-containing protein [Lampropedia aestuarii]THJ33235.1 DUF4880 domain-containing protein [Lampropedia aestuarii]